MVKNCFDIIGYPCSRDLDRSQISDHFLLCFWSPVAFKTNICIKSSYRISKLPAQFGIL